MAHVRVDFPRKLAPRPPRAGYSWMRPVRERAALVTVTFTRSLDGAQQNDIVCNNFANSHMSGACKLAAFLVLANSRQIAASTSPNVPCDACSSSCPVGVVCADTTSTQCTACLACIATSCLGCADKSKKCKNKRCESTYSKKQLEYYLRSVRDYQSRFLENGWASTYF